jgi:hypothetical protein
MGVHARLFRQFLSALHTVIPDQAMLKIYTDRSHLSLNAEQTGGKQYVPVDMLRPFLSSPQEGYISGYVRIAPELFLLVDDPAAADIGVLPLRYGRYVSLKRLDAVDVFAETMRHAGKPWAIFDIGDTYREIKTDAHVFRVSVYGSRRGSNVHGYTGAITDVVDHFMESPLPVRLKSDVPIVGFCGQVPPAPTLRSGASQLLANALTRFGLENTAAPFHTVHLRSGIIRRMQQSTAIQTNFVLRPHYMGERGAKNDDAEQRRREFITNMAESDYVLCVRGFANFSFRFYETLAAGRIPVLVNTDCVLPYDRIIDWKKYVVWVEMRDLPHIGEVVREFHNRLRPDEFANLQRECRRVFDEWVSMHGFFKNFWRHFS